MTMITPSYLGETIEYSSLHACRSTLEDPTCFHHAALKGFDGGITKVLLEAVAYGILLICRRCFRVLRRHSLRYSEVRLLKLKTCKVHSEKRENVHGQGAI